MSTSGNEARCGSDQTDLSGIVDEVAHLLPAQGPISVFIHHNTLHAFEHLPFEEAVVIAGQKLGCEPFLSEDRYRTELRRGRITLRDVDAVLAQDLGDRATEHIAGLVTRFDLRRRTTTLGVPEARGATLFWLLGETSVLERFREDLPRDARRDGAVADRHPGGSVAAGDDEAARVRALWNACLGAVRRTRPVARGHQLVPHRHRDLFLATCGIDTDDWIHPVLIRFVSAYLDQGLAHWPMPLRERGMYACFLDTYASPLAHLCAPWGRNLPPLIAQDREEGRTGPSSLRSSLVALGVPEDQWRDFLTDTALALRGWAGMVRQIEERPDRVPTRAVPAKLVDFLAVRLLLERAAWTHAARTEAHCHGSLAETRAELRTRIPPTPRPTDADRAWPLFHVAQLCGLDAATINRLSIGQVDALETELCEFDGVGRRRVLHQAYERHLRHRFYDGLTRHAPAPARGAPAWQTISCLDEREESFRRHLEEVDPGVETLGAAGFFGVAMYYRGVTDAHPRPLCPVAIHPEHFVAEAAEDPHGPWARWRRLRERGAGLVDKNLHIGSRTLVRGGILMAALGVLSIVPLVLRVVFPWVGQRLARLDLPLAAGPRTRLRVDRESSPPPIGRHAGFTVDEMATIVRGQLENVGIRDRLSSLILVIGHGSVSLNNPHESAHDCGACGGGRGGPNARAFAQMANDPRVRGVLAAEGLRIPPSTWFVGAERNTANNRVALFDENAVPQELRPQLEHARAALEAATEREAHERCRRFEAVPSWLPPRAALLHVESRAADLAQPRPEYGHATNAVCVIGRRSRTKGLFLDRRAFLLSYDPTLDLECRVLERLLAAVVPVVAGINLEYYFSYVDPTGYGCGTKLPHNVTSLLGVMDGAQSDLRTGLPWQMVEIHEPVRLCLVVESPRGPLMRILETNAALRRLVDNHWIFLACLDPDSDALWETAGGGFERYAPELPVPIAAGDSRSFCRGKRGHLPFTRLEAVHREGSAA
jgi:uncharacterized protein YbcC (UPF0753/DUF2309 family)